MHEHPVIGERILRPLPGFAMVATAVRHEHERWDGGGYPDALAGEQIPLVGRLVHVADVFDVLVHERPYKDAFRVEDAAEEITGGAGSQFDPEIVEAFSALGPRVWLAAPGLYGG
jgi:HD-GYP domain-containing protein (c-di-GMP phosphodiesterase class II)